MSPRMPTFLLALALLAAPAEFYGQRKRQPPKPCAKSLSTCKPEGCDTGDGLLNQQKNRKDKPAERDVEEMSVRDIIALNGKGTPTKWKKDSPRDDLITLGEGKGVRVTGFLINAHQTSGTETTNCHLPGPANNDFHLNIVQTKPNARPDELTKAQLKEAKKAAMKLSVVIEMSPQSRNKGWSLPRVQALSDMFTYVRVTGWLLLDTEHAAFKSLPRATAWEIHPITKFEVCTDTKAKCDRDESLWKPLERLR